MLLPGPVPEEVAAAPGALEIKSFIDARLTPRMPLEGDTHRFCALTVYHVLACRPFFNNLCSCSFPGFFKVVPIEDDSVPDVVSSPNSGNGTRAIWDLLQQSSSRLLMTASFPLGFVEDHR